MAIKYLYLDDESPEVVRSFVREIEHHTPELSIQLMLPKPFAQQMEEFEPFDGVILDLRLDQYGNKVGYRATSLAQEIRTRAAEGGKDCPLVLWSTDARLTPSYTKDNSGHDLFDLKCVKTVIADDEEQARLAGMRMASLAVGYNHVKSTVKGTSPTLDLIRCLGFDKEPEFLDPRITIAFARRSGRLPAHEFAQFILPSMLGVPGPLLDADWVAARLGIDRTDSSDFTVLCERYLSDFAYRGVFASGWPRWWGIHLETWWRGLDRSHKSLRLTPADQRVESIKRLTRLKNLVPATALRQSDSNAFWTVCQATGRPIDPRDGFVLDSPHSELWQEKMYVSASAAFSGALRNYNLRISVLEEERFKRARQINEVSKSKSKNITGNSTK